MTGNPRKHDEREDHGVIEVVGFVLIIAVIITSVGLLYVAAFQSMHSYQDDEQVKSATQGMEALTSNFNDVLRQDKVDQRSSELVLQDGTIRLEEGTHLTINVN